MSSNRFVFGPGTVRGAVLPLFVAALGSNAPVAVAVAAESSSATSVAPLEEIVVTARKRDENLQDVPVAVSVVDGAALAPSGIKDSTSLFGRVPSLYFSNNNNVGVNQDSQFLVLRGVGSNPILEPSTGVFIDGVYQSGAGFDIGFLDLQRIEILRGPQGTLFGRNTEAGALNLVTRKPGPEFRATTFAEVDDMTSYRARGGISGAITENWFAGVSAGYEHTDGYIKNLTLSRDQMRSHTEMARLALRYLPSDRAEVNISVDGSQTKGGIQGIGVRDVAGEVYHVEDDQVRDQDRYNFGLAVNARIDWDPVSFTSISGYRRTSTDAGNDVDGVAVPAGNFQTIAIDQYTASQEFRLASRESASALSWLVGTYYFHEKNDVAFDLTLPDGRGFAPIFDFLEGARTGSQTSAERDGWALFGQMSYRPITLVELTAGLRYSHEKTDFAITNLLSIPAFGLLEVSSRTPPGGAFEDSDTSPLGSITLHWAPEFMTYASVAKGFKAGGFNRFAGSSETLLPFRSESAINHEIGAKSTLFDGRLTLNVAAFRIDIEDQQLLSVVRDSLGVPQVLIASVGEARSSGGEVEVTARPSENLRLSGNVSYTKTRYESFVDADGVDRAGDPFPNVPKVTASLSADYEWPLAGDRSVTAGASYRYIDDYISGSGVVSDPIYRIPSYGILDLQFGLKQGDAWRIGLFVRNATDEYAISNRIYAYFFPKADPATTRNTVLAPRTYGINFTYAWD